MAYHPLLYWQQTYMHSGWRWYFCPRMQSHSLVQHEKYMYMALQEAEKAFAMGEVPVGAVVVAGSTILGRGHNQTELLKDVTAHAEILALTAAFSYMGAKYLPEATLYVTLEPCHMCAGALYWSKIGHIVYGGADVKHGYRKFYGEAWPFHPKTQVTAGVLAHPCAQLMIDFFAARRK